MTREEMVNLIEFVAICCPQQKINRLTTVAWYEIIGHLEFDVARNAVIAAKHSQAFVDPSDIIREADAARRRDAHPAARTVAEALAAANTRELDAAEGAPPNAEFLAAKAAMDAKLKQRDEHALLVNRATQRRAQDWIDYKLSGKLPAHLPPLGSPPPPRWVQLPGDPPELRAWLVRQAAVP